MGRIICYGSLTPHHPWYGINHKNIAKKLTLNNWKTKAIVRASIYIYIDKGCVYNKDDKDTIIYTVFGIDKHQSFDYLDEAISYANNFADYEGNYPLQSKPKWHIGPVMKYPVKEKK